MYNKYRAKTVKEKSTENIKDFMDNKILYTLSKPHSPQTIVFVEDKEDPWFVYVKTYKTKSGIITDSSQIIASDVATRLTHLKAVGYVEA
jgi:hypothetical protein